MGCFSMEEDALRLPLGGPYIASRQVAVNENSDIYKLSDLEGKNLAVSPQQQTGRHLSEADG